MLKEPRKSWLPLCIHPSFSRALERIKTQNCIFFSSRGRNNLWEVSTQWSSVSNTENLPTFTHPAEWESQCFPTRVGAMGSLGCFRLTVHPQILQSVYLSCYVSMIYEGYRQNHFMQFFCFVLIYYLLFIVLSPVTTMEFPSLLIWPVSILPIYFNFLFWGAGTFT